MNRRQQRKRSQRRRGAIQRYGFETARLVWLGNYLKAVRQDRDLSTRDLEALARVSCAHISRIENGRFVCTLLTFLRLCRALELSPVSVMARMIA